MNKKQLIKALSSYQLWLIVGLIVIILIGVGAAYIMLKQSQSSSIPSSTQTTSSSVSTTTSPQYSFLVFTQKGIAEIINPSSTTPFQGYTHSINISTNVPQQVYWWVEYPFENAAQSRYYLIPVNNGTVYAIDANSLKIVKEFNFGNSIGFIGVAYSPSQQLVAVADGPSGILALINVSSLNVLWEQHFVSPVNGRTYYPCDVRWSPDGNYLIVPMRFNNSVDLIALNGSLIKVLPTAAGSQPYMVSPNMQGTMVAVEYVGNNSVGFYSLPSLKLLGILQMPNGTIPQRGVFTPNGDYYLEAPSNTNQVFVISTSTFQIVKTIDLPSFSVKGLADIELMPGGQYAYVVIHGNVQSGGIIALISVSSLTVSSYVPLSTAPAVIIPVQNQVATYLVDNVLLPPVTGLHC
ncbi:conserved hypothetical protein [Sulfolobus islandicus Y.G.57.14]|uniref:YncE family protein n=3 Tax=Saccharolobus islandicus TaxID=43080 RepID=C3MKN7_SACI2|nr:YncE family protein [Sulfolobus islandicus]ACP36408.1 conserved hypothetical protein [Sulfolobus islandicus L.S.2.15]ACP46652.1 conserved hypothetical protein [Sulfolobus islandicus Y.G.57.14]ACP47652.1 conserved hypothetical protein [Sulfolobus islandicus Y.N.15.51]